MIPVYVKKPIPVEALQLHITNKQEVIAWITRNGIELPVQRMGERGLYIETHEGLAFAKYGDYIIKGIKGEFYPCSEEIFNLTYEPLNKCKWD
jgi:hypothetical protein